MTSRFFVVISDNDKDYDDGDVMQVASVYVEDPARTRIMQWTNLSNPDGMRVHLLYNFCNWQLEKGWFCLSTRPIGNFRL